MVNAAGPGQDELAKPHQCKHCLRRFTTSSNLGTHIRNNCKKAPLVVEEVRAITQPSVAELMKEIQELRATMAAAALVPQKPPTVQVASTIINVTINAFGKESTDHIGPDTIRRMLDETLARGINGKRAAFTAMINAAELIYSDERHPENITCYIPDEHDLRKALVHISDGQGGLQWHLRPCEEVIPPMARKATDLVFDNQPYQNAMRYDELMRALRDNEPAFQHDKEMQSVLVRNRRLLIDKKGEPASK